MDIKTWSEQLDKALLRQGISASERRAAVNYYNEIFQDKRSDGISEREILKEFGFPEDVALSVAENGDYIKPNEETPIYTHTDKTDTAALDNDVIIDNEEAENQGAGRKTDSSANKRKRYNDDNYNRTEPEENYYAVKADTHINGCMTLLLFPLTLLLGFVGVIVFIVLFSVGIALPIAGLATFVAGFLIIAENFGAFLIALGTGMALFAAGCMLFLCIIALAKGYWQLLKFCLGVRRNRR